MRNFLVWGPPPAPSRENVPTMMQGTLTFPLECLANVGLRAFIGNGNWLHQEAATEAAPGRPMRMKQEKIRDVNAVLRVSDRSGKLILPSRQGFRNLLSGTSLRAQWTYYGALLHNPIMEGWATNREQLISGKHCPLLWNPERFCCQTIYSVLPGRHSQRRPGCCGMNVR